MEQPRSWEKSSERREIILFFFKVMHTIIIFIEKKNHMI